MARTNFLIGNGESLVTKVNANSGSGEKSHPYSYEERVEDLEPILGKVIRQIDELPAGACPNDEAVIAVTLHPSYLAKSYHPNGLLKELGLRQVGSRQTSVNPLKTVRKKPIHVATELFIAGPRQQLHDLRPLEGTMRSEIFQDDFRKIETVRALGDERLKGEHLKGERIPLEVVLHVGGDGSDGERILSGFEEWCEQIGVEILDDRSVGGLTFVNARADEDELEALAEFAFLRLARRMPKLAFRPMALRAAPTSEEFEIDIEGMVPLSDRARVAVLDGGLPEDHPFGNLAVRREPIGIGSPAAFGLAHGMQTTSAALFGPLEEGEDPPAPFSPVDHWRVIDDEGDDFDLTMTLDRIANILETEDYDAVNLSLGPDLPVDDDHVHIWTATMDAIAARNRTLIISAAGNNGADDPISGLNRVQPSADGVNVLAVGAQDRLGNGWVRAPYSAVGPGRSPGLIKPDCVAVGGTDFDPYFAISGHGLASGTSGTSFSAPTVLRLSGGLKSTFSQLSPTAVRALLVHTSDPGKHDKSEVGWGSVCHDLSDLIASADDAATVVYQGELGVQSMRRYSIPCPTAGFSSDVILTATFVVASMTEPEDSVTYTTAGAEIFFRPITTGHPGLTPKGKPKLHPTSSFFSSGKMFQTEQELRTDALQWESVKRHSHRFKPGKLDQPIFDIQHHARSHGGAGRRDAAVPYALIVTIQEPDNLVLYDDILRAHSSLRAMVPGIIVPTGS